MIRGQLEIQNLPQAPKYQILPEEFLILGRGHNADVVLQNDSAVSRLHCKFFYADKQFWVQDLGSRNRTMVNQTPVMRQALAHGDVVQVGHFTVLFSLLQDKAIELPVAPENFLNLKRSDKLTGKIAVKLGLLAKEKLKECGKKQDDLVKEGPYYPLEEILLHEHYLSREQLDSIEEYKRRAPFTVAAYQFDELIGMGGMGHIYKARATSDGRVVAIKVFSGLTAGMPSELEVPLREQFRREATAMLLMTHSNIVRGLEFGEQERHSYIVMEYVDGPTLQQELKDRGGRLLADEALGYIIQVAKALEHANRHSLTHRDIKPENVLLTSDKVVKLCDFGLVKNAAGAEPKEDKTFGTVAYMSPEQIRGDRTIDIRSDIYSLGAVFYRILFGKLPFIGDNQKIRQQHLTQPLTFPNEGRHFQKMELARIISKMMAKDPDSRYQLPTALLRDLDIAKSHFSEHEHDTISATEEVVATDELPRLRDEFAVTAYRLPRVKLWYDLARRAALWKAVGLLLALAIVWVVGKIVWRERQASQLYQVVVAAIRISDHQEAERAARQFLATFPKHQQAVQVRSQLQQAIYLKADESYRAGQLQEAATLCQDLIALAAQSPVAEQGRSLHDQIVKAKEDRQRREEVKQRLSRIDALLAQRHLSTVRQLLESPPRLTPQESREWEQRQTLWARLTLQEQLSAFRNYDTNALPQLVGLQLPAATTSPITIARSLMGGGKPAVRPPLVNVRGSFFMVVAGAVHCLAADSGKLRWSHYFGTDGTPGWLLGKSAMATDDPGQAEQVLLTAVGSTIVRMVTCESGRLVWERQLPAPLATQPVWQWQELLLPCTDSYAYRLKAMSGEISGALRTPTPACQAAANSARFQSQEPQATGVAYDLWYLACTDGRLYGFDANAGRLRLCLPYPGKLCRLIVAPVLGLVSDDGNTVRLTLYPQLTANLATGPGGTTPSLSILHEQIPPAAVSLTIPGTLQGDLAITTEQCWFQTKQHWATLSFKRLRTEPEQCLKLLPPGPILQATTHLPNGLLLGYGEKMGLYSLANDANQWQKIWEYQPKETAQQCQGQPCLPWQKLGNLYFIATERQGQYWANLLLMQEQAAVLTWQKRLTLAPHSLPVAVKDGLLWLTLSDGALAQLTFSKGKLLPTVRTGAGQPFDTVASHLLLAGKTNLLVIASQGGPKMYDGLTGKATTWQSKEPVVYQAVPPTVTPQLAKWGDQLLLLPQGQVLKVMKLGTGEKVAEFVTPDQATISTIPVYSQGVILFGTSTGQYFCLQLVATRTPATLRKVWNFRMRGPVEATPVVSGREVYLAGERLYCLNLETGKSAWQLDLASTIRTTPLLQDKAIYVVTETGVLHAIARSTGKLLWQSKLPGQLRLLPLYLDGKLYTVTPTGRIVVCYAETGKVAAELQLEHAVDNLMFAWQENIYIGSHNGWLYGLHF